MGSIQNPPRTAMNTLVIHPPLLYRYKSEDEKGGIMAESNRNLAIWRNSWTHQNNEHSH